jgi:hypothetical protein
MVSYSVSDVRRGYDWLGFDGRLTELAVLSPLYRPGDRRWNRRHESWPIIKYVSSLDELLLVVREYAGRRLLCYGINPRSEVLADRRGRLQSSTETALDSSQTLLLDFDLDGTVSPSRLAALTRVLGRVDAYCASLGLQRGVRASTGRGSHLLFAYPPMAVRFCPDLRDRQARFRDGVFRAVRQDLSRLEARLDRTQDLRRMARVYGTPKPEVGVVSRFFATTRVEDPALREYLLSLPSRPPTTTTGAVAVVPGGALPSWFTELLVVDGVVRNLWNGTGKPSGTDVSRSGYDYSLACHLITAGHSSPDELGTILSLRPGGGAHKRVSYVSRTVNNALRRAAVKA